MMAEEIGLPEIDMAGSSHTGMSIEELTRLGNEVFDRKVRPLLRPEDNGKFVAIDVLTGEYEMDADDYAAVSQLRGRRPSAEVWLVRAGHPTAYQIRLRR